MKNKPIVLGELYREAIFDIEGILMSREEHMHLGILGTIDVPDKKEPNKRRQYTFPLQRLSRVKGQKKPFKSTTAGKKHKIKFGTKYRDGVSGIEGVATARIEHLTGCERVKLQFMQLDGELMQTEVDESILVLIPATPKAKVKPVVKKKSRPGAISVTTSLAQ